MFVIPISALQDYSEKDSSLKGNFLLPGKGSQFFSFRVDQF